MLKANSSTPEPPIRFSTAEKLKLPTVPALAPVIDQMLVAFGPDQVVGGRGAADQSLDAGEPAGARGGRGGEVDCGGGAAVEGVVQRVGPEAAADPAA